MMRAAANQAGAAAGSGLDGFGLQPAAQPAALLTGLVIGLAIMVAAISYPALIFAGELAPYAPIGLRLGLFSALVLSAVLALTSSYPGAVGVGQSEPAVVLGVSAAAIAGTLASAGAPERILPTVLAAIGSAAALTGLFFLTLGVCRQGNLIRFVPFPVIGGFLAGIGWLLIKGAFAALTGSSLSWSEPARLIEGANLLRWGPPAAFAVVLYHLQQRRPHYLNLLGVVAGAIVLFWVAAWLTGTSTPTLRAEGWLLGTSHDQVAWQPFQPIRWSAVDWPVLRAQLPQLASLLIIALIGLLLTASSVELVARRDVDLNRELCAAGLGNLLGAAGGGMPGYHSLTGCTLAARLGAPVRLIGLTSALLCAGGLFFGMSLLALVPKWVVGTVLLYVGLGFLVEWLHQARLRLPRGDYAVLVLVFLGVVFVGLVEGIALGVLAGVVLFVFNYSRVSVIRTIASGTALRSNRTRPEPMRNLLRRHGGEIFVLRLQGYLFFATANRLLERLRARLADPRQPPLRCLILDFRQVSGLDSSTVISFAKLTRHAEQGGFKVVLTGLEPAMALLLRQAGIGVGEDPVVQLLADLDHGLEWSEDQVLQARAGPSDELNDPLEVQLARVFPAAAQVAAFMRYLEPVSWPAGARLIEQGDRSDDLFFVEHGQVTVQLQTAGREPVRLRTMSAGTVVGEAAFYLGLPRSASVVADTETTAYRLARSTLERMQDKDPALAALFHSFMARLLAARVIETTQLIETDLL